MRRSLPALALLAALGALSLTGCSAGGGNGDDTTAGSTQSVADACTIAGTSLSDVQTDMSDSLSALGTGDANSAADAVTKLGEKLGEAEDNVANAKVKAAVVTLGDKVSEFADLVTKAKDGGVQVLAGEAGQIQSVAADIQAAGQKISDLCS